MESSTTKLIQMLSEFLSQNKKVNEVEIYDFLISIKGKIIPSEEFEFQAELRAFAFYPSESAQWGIFYGPMMTYKGDDGQWYESPSISSINEEHLKYWSKRAEESTNEILKIRYADLIWDFASKIDKKYRNIKFAHMVIDNTIALINKQSYSNELDGIKLLKRAFSLALSINDNDRILILTEVLIQYEENIAIDDKAGLWGFCFDLLIGNKKVTLTDAQKDKIVNDLLNRLDRVSQSGKNLHPYAAEEAATRLITYYRSTNNEAQALDIIRKYGRAYIEASKANSGMIASSMLQKIYEVYSSNGLANELVEVSMLLNEANKKTLNELKPITKEFQIPEQTMKDFIEAILGKDFSEALTLISTNFLPKVENLKKEIIETSKVAPLFSMISSSIIDADGRVVAKVGSVEEDMDGRIVQLMIQHFQIQYVWMWNAFSELKKKYNPTVDDFISYLYQSPLFLEGRKEIIKKGLTAYLNNDHITAAHLLIPQIENALRVLLKLNNGDIYKPHRNGGLLLKNLDEILRTKIVIDVFDNDIITFIRVVLTDQRGFNLRNNVMHGIIDPAQLTSFVLDRILIILIILGQVRLV